MIPESHEPNERLACQLRYKLGNNIFACIEAMPPGLVTTLVVRFCLAGVLAPWLDMRAINDDGYNRYIYHSVGEFEDVLPSFTNRRFGRPCHVIGADMPNISTIIRDTLEVDKITKMLMQHVMQYEKDFERLIDNLLPDHMAWQRALDVDRPADALTTGNDIQVDRVVDEVVVDEQAAVSTYVRASMPGRRSTWINVD